MTQRGALSANIASCIRSARTGSHDDLGELLEVFRPELTQLAEAELKGRLRKRMAVSDLVQDTLLTASSRFTSFRGSSPAEFRKWLMEVFHSRLVDGIRRHRVAERRAVSRENASASGLSTSPDDSPSTISSMNEEARRLLLALEQLPAHLQEVVRLRYVHDLTFEAVAEQTGMSLSTVWRRWGEAVEHLRRSISGP